MTKLKSLRKTVPAGIAAMSMLAVVPAFASGPVFYTGTDAGASSLSSLNQSKTAQTNFLAAAGAVTTETFETTNMGGTHAVNTLGGYSDGAMSINFSGTSASHIYDQVMELEQPGNSSTTNGFNTTTGGNKYMFIEPTYGATSTTTFNFTKSIDAFGLYISGLGNNNLTLNATFNDGTQRSFVVTGTQSTAGTQYLGFIDQGAAINSITFTQATTASNRDRFSIDDISFRAAPTPEASTLLILAVSIGGMMMFGNKRKRVIA
jgi:hypothetical protein